MAIDGQSNPADGIGHSMPVTSAGREVFPSVGYGRDHGRWIRAVVKLVEQPPSASASRPFVAQTASTVSTTSISANPTTNVAVAVSAYPCP